MRPESGREEGSSPPATSAGEPWRSCLPPVASQEEVRVICSRRLPALSTQRTMPASSTGGSRPGTFSSTLRGTSTSPTSAWVARGAPPPIATRSRSSRLRLPAIGAGAGSDDGDWSEERSPGLVDWQSSAYSSRPPAVTTAIRVTIHRPRSPLAPWRSAVSWRPGRPRAWAAPLTLAPTRPPARWVRPRSPGNR